MSEFEGIERTRFLQEKKEEIETQLSVINAKIELNQSDCSHVGVYMGNYDDGNGCRCVLCNSKLNNEQMMTLAAKGLVIYAHNYLNHTQPTHMGKFDAIQTMYLGLSRMDKLTSDKEIVVMFQEMINQNLETKGEVEEKGLAKVLKKDDDHMRKLGQIIRKDFEEDE